jgi:hypothetical protein
MSFDSSGLVSGTMFADEDLLFFDPSGGSWSLAFDGSANNEAWIAADLEATHAFLFSDIIFYSGFESLISLEPEAASQ